LLESGYKVVNTTVGKNGPVTVLSNGTKTYSIYTATSTGESSVQVMIGDEVVSKIRLIGD
jgi:filamentous hemagglutinin